MKIRFVRSCVPAPVQCSAVVCVGGLVELDLFIVGLCFHKSYPEVILYPSPVIRGMAPVYPSSTKVKCGYHGCSFHGLKKNLKKHMERFHKGQAVLIKNTGFGIGGRWQVLRLPTHLIHPSGKIAFILIHPTEV